MRLILILLSMAACMMPWRMALAQVPPPTNAAVPAPF